MNQTAMDDGGLLGIPAAAFPGIAKELYTVNYNIGNSQMCLCGLISPHKVKAASSALLFWDVLLTFDREVVIVLFFMSFLAINAFHFSGAIHLEVSPLHEDNVLI